MKIKNQLPYSWDTETPLFGKLFSSDEEETQVENTPGKNSQIKIAVSIGGQSFNCTSRRDQAMDMLGIFLNSVKEDFLKADLEAKKTKEVPY